MMDAEGDVHGAGGMEEDAALFPHGEAGAGEADGDGLMGEAEPGFGEDAELGDDDIIIQPE